MTARIALLRGINVGGHNRLPMATLREIVEGLGGEQVRTYIQSGNVVFESVAGAPVADAARWQAAIREATGIESPVVLRTGGELAAAVAANPWAGTGVDERELAIAFLAAEPTSEQVASLDPDRSPPDAFEVVGREVHLRLPNGVARSKLTNAWFDSRLGTVSTARNWRTTMKLLEWVSD